MKITKKQIYLLAIVVSFGMLLQSCTKEQAHNEVEHSHSHDGTHSHEHNGHMHDSMHSHSHENMDLVNAGFIKLKDMYFKLSPDISKRTGQTHLDFYFRDSEGKHISGAEIKLDLNSPDGKKESFTLDEDLKGEHYHTKTKLSSYGEYNSIVQVDIDGEKYNPRFAFTHVKE